MNKVLRLKINEKGRDFIVGDVHGNFHLLKKALSKVNFNQEVDRIIVAGDLVDRGRNSKIAQDWLKKDYFFSVMGNHDAQFAFKDDLELFPGEMICIPFDAWFVNIPTEVFEDLCKTFREKLYPAIEIETKNGIVGVVHAEIPEGINWTEFKERLNGKDYKLFKKAIWGRDIAKKAIVNRDNSEFNPDKFIISDLLYVFHGHTPSGTMNFKPYSIGNRHYIDTCSYKNYEEAGLSIFDITNPNQRLFKVSD